MAGARRSATALAVFALLLQIIAPFAIAPPRGQPAHFAHSHHEHHPSGKGERPPQDAPACPVCNAMQAGGAGLHVPVLAPAPVLSIAERVAISLRLGPRSAEHRAHHRAPPAMA